MPITDVSARGESCPELELQPELPVVPREAFDTRCRPPSFERPPALMLARSRMPTGTHVRSRSNPHLARVSQGKVLRTARHWRQHPIHACQTLRSSCCGKFRPRSSLSHATHPKRFAPQMRCQHPKITVAPSLAPHSAVPVLAGTWHGPLRRRTRLRSRLRPARARSCCCSISIRR